MAASKSHSYRTINYATLTDDQIVAFTKPDGKLNYFNCVVCPFAQRVLWAALEVQAPIDTVVELDVFNLPPSYSRLVNRYGDIPHLIHDGTHVYDSPLTVNYLDATFGRGKLGRRDTPKIAALTDLLTLKTTHIPFYGYLSGRDKNEERKFFLNKFKATHGVSERQFCRDNKLAFSTWQGWRTNEAKILASKRHGRLATLGGQGLRELIPFKNELLAFMRDRRGTERYVRVFHLMRWVKRHHRPWLVDYLSTKKNDAVGYNSFRTLLLRFSYRHRFRHRVPCKSKLSQQVLDDVWLGYAASFWNKYSEYDKSQILNVDETGVFYDMPPGKTLAEIGMSSKVSDGEKHSDRLTAVLTIRADGKRSLYDVSLCLHCTGVKLPLLFILKGQPGGVIERQELDTYPRGHHYAVQTNAWMDERVWSIYLDEVLAPQVEDASVLLVDNLACHVSDSSYDKVAETLFSVVEPLPPNSTSRCQPLDVGVMGPLKAMLKTAWLLEEDDRIGDEVFTAQEKRLAMVKRTISVWEKISTQTIVKSFEKAIPSVLEI
ncbi:hypothetical protein DYB30_007009 [Aphanomyces astaci]|uniref:GST N-terminal domain-containing protein n=2 Tax=Aphanomyces astaci TaxID=112090 RepID=A0A397D793_APHAT|nr:hypothetical protein DYB34_003851 [Aphanomyces astaci]RHY43690.1 hypothetical protein DYB38_011737 [Aphanomyces astaci]RHY60057.1 hypothetical protein DYB30_007009 [Aphanomyces astaci]